MAGLMGTLRQIRRAIPVRFGYDAVDDAPKRRRAAQVLQMSEDLHLDAFGRRKLVATTRDLRRNYEIAAWMIRKHLDYVSTFTFQARTSRDDFNRQLEDLMKAKSKRENFDVTGRHNRQRFIRLCEACRTVDGDVGVMKLADGRVQAIEGDRIRTPWTGLPKGVDTDRLIHGVLTNPAGAAVAYCLNNRLAWGDGFEFDRMVSADRLLLHGYFDRFDQVRGISPLSAALNRMRDTYENFDYALAKAKVTQLFALSFYRQAEEALGDITAATDTTGAPVKSETKVDFGRGPMTLDLEPGERAEFLESRHPSLEFRQFSDAMIAVALKALDIPFSFFAENFSNYSGSRQALLLYEQSAETKQADNRGLLDGLTTWWISLWMLDGKLTLPTGWRLEDITWEWIHRGIPWIQPLQEVQADTKAVEGGLTSRQRIAKRQGEDWWEIADELEAEEQRIATWRAPAAPPGNPPLDNEPPGDGEQNNADET